MKPCNLVLVHRGPAYRRDFQEICEKIRVLDPAIATFALGAHEPLHLPDRMWANPTLTVAFTKSFQAKIRRGPIVRNLPVEKLAQAKIFAKAGIPTPPAQIFRFGQRLDPILFGEFVVVKPMNLRLTSHGEGILLFRRRRLEQLRYADLAADHPLRRIPGGFLVQRYVHTGTHIAWNRVSSLFGRPLYSVRSISSRPQLDLSASDAAIEGADITNVREPDRVQALSNETDVLALARRVHDSMPDVPLLGIDILREQVTGSLYVLEVNPGGNTWHFSSPEGRDWRRSIGLSAQVAEEDAEQSARRILMTQFGAFDVAARVLVEKTREIAT